MLSYPINDNMRETLKRFPNIARLVLDKMPRSGRSKLEIVRLLGNTHYENIEQVLTLLNKWLPSSGSIGDRILHQTDQFEFEQALAEFFLLVHFRNVQGVEARPTVQEQLDLKNYDIDLFTDESRVRVEVYSPVDFFGAQLLERMLSSLFKYLDVEKGFDINLRIETSVKDGSYAYETGKQEIVREWLKRLKSEAEEWVMNADPGHQERFNGPTDQIWLDAELKDVCNNPEPRQVRVFSPSQSTDSRLFFEVGSPEDTAKSQWGRRLRNKLKKRQCGEPDPSYLRLLIVNFSLADTSFPDFICWPRIAKRLRETLILLSDKARPPLPYDCVLPARLDTKCCFGRVIALDSGNTEKIKRFVEATSLDHPCVNPNVDQEPFINDLLDFIPSKK